MTGVQINERLNIVIEFSASREHVVGEKNNDGTRSRLRVNEMQLSLVMEETYCFENVSELTQFLLSFLRMRTRF